MIRMLCGLVVDEEGYERFGKKQYSVLNDIVEQKRTLTLEKIEFFANCEDYKKNYPEFVAECKKIVENAVKEIKSYYAARDGREEYKVMKHPNFTGYLKDIQEVQKEAEKKQERLQETLEKARKEWEENRKTTGQSEAWMSYRKSEYLEAEENFKSSIAELRASTAEKLNEIQKELEEHLDDFYAPNGSKLDDPTVKLLNSGIQLKAKELDLLIRKYMDNTTMLRLLVQYGETHEVRTDLLTIVGHYAKLDGKKERELFGELRGVAEKTITQDKATFNIYQKHFGSMCIDCIANMEKLPVRPAE